MRRLSVTEGRVADTGKTDKAWEEDGQGMNGLAGQGSGLNGALRIAYLMA